MFFKSGTKKIFTALLFSGIFFNVFSLDLNNVSSTLSDIFSFASGENEGTTIFRSLLIPYGGRSESMGNAYTGLCDDIVYMQYNPAAGAIQKETQFSIFHNAWIADSKIDSMAFTIRVGDFGFGTFLSCFYVPFTEYNFFGERVSSSYYSETTAGVNFSYNLLSGYNFKGLAMGFNLKTALRGMPGYTDNDSNEMISGTALEQSAVAVIGDFGLMTQFNLFKFYSSRDPNVRIGVSAQNIGVAFTGFGSSKGLQLDDGLPSLLCAGLSVRLIKPILLSADLKQPVNFFDIKDFSFPYLSSGIAIDFTNFLSLLGGLEIKGGNPKISAGFEFEASKVRFNANYTLDLTTSVSPINRISLSAKILMGDRGRSLVDEKIDELYKLGLVYYSEAEWQKAIDIWNQVLKLNKHFDPAILGIQSAQHQINMFNMIKESLLLD